MLNLRETISRHCIKLYLYPDSKYTYHWMKELRSFFSNIHKLNDINRTYDVYYTNISYIHDIYDMDENDIGYITMSDFYNDIIVEYDIEETRNDLLTCIKWYVKLIQQVIPILIAKKFDEDKVFDLLYNIFEIEE